MKTVSLSIPALNASKLVVNVPENSLQAEIQPLAMVVVEAIRSLPTKSPWLNYNIRRVFARELAKVLLDENICRPIVPAMFLNEYWALAIDKKYILSAMDNMSNVDLLERVVFYVLEEELKAIDGPSQYVVQCLVELDVWFNIEADKDQDIEDLAVSYIEDKFGSVGGLTDLSIDVKLEMSRKIV